MATKLEAVVTVTPRDGQDVGTVEREVHVHTLEDLYAACRNAPPSDLVRLVLRGPDGVARFEFASFGHA